MLKKRFTVIFLVHLTVFACTSKPESQSEPPTSSTNTPITLPTQVAPLPTETPIPTTTPPQLQPTATPVAEVQVDPCNLVPQSSVEAILGEQVQVSRELNACTYPTLSNSRSIGIHVVTGEDAKLPLLTGIAQFREGCSININYSSNQPTATPLPPEIQELGSRSLVELMVLYEEAVLECGLSEDEFQIIDGLGDHASFLVMDLVFWKVGTVSVALGETYLAFNYVEFELDPIFAYEAGLSLAQEALQDLP